jgi:RNA polymerase sigma-70 factor, ECF subfamily
MADIPHVQADLLYTEHGKGVERYCANLLHDREDGADAAQDVWLRVLGSTTATRLPDDAVRPWIFTVARHVCIDRMRLRSRASLGALEDADLPSTPPADVSAELYAELRSVLDDVAKLSRQHRAALLLREVRGLTHTEIAAALGVDTERSRGLLREARAALHARRDGREMTCEAARRELGRRKLRDQRLRGHIEACPSCRAFERRRRDKRLSSALAFPLGLVRAVVDRFAVGAGNAAGAAESLGSAGAAKIATACAVAAIAVVGAGTATDRRPDRPREASPDPTAPGAGVRATDPSAPAPRGASVSGRRLERAAGEGRRRRDREGGAKRPAPAKDGPTREKGSAAGVADPAAPAGERPSPEPGEPSSSPVTPASGASKPPSSVKVRVPAVTQTVENTVDRVGGTVSGAVDSTGQTVSGVTGGLAGE